MVVLSQSILENFSDIKTCKPTSNTFNAVPVIDLSDPDSKTSIIKACQQFGFFKVINHGVPVESFTRLEAEAFKFFNLPQSEKDTSGPPNPFGYGSKKIGRNGDVGWVEYLLFSANNERSFCPKNSQLFRSLVREYVTEVREMACVILEMIADGLNIGGPKNVLSRHLRDERSDSIFRLNHYPPCPDQFSACRNLVGFGEHTDPQILSVLRSNNSPGLQICLNDASWVSVPPDHNSFFFLVGDSLQVMTNGRFKSVKHRVLAGDSCKSRLSMIYLGGPPLSEKITPIPTLMEDGEESLFKEFTWCEYKNSAYKTRLGDNRLCLFEKSSTHPVNS